ncbi:DUF5518 domain-containing protein [Natrononativus amylolyticus]|uniref:DUF5518 domain-containing protein n=1 Tax=Natrononativus amylolyticus TaxID=2963434 RepID=UPI0020CE0BB6|nr:DUF5518 domain-containing protein [Natrononativus amylolyticus]
MVNTTSPSATTDTPPAEANSNALINGLIGGIAGIILSFVPLSTLLGGIIAGYLEGGRPEAGLKVGAIAGLIMLVPFIFILLFGMVFLGFGWTPVAFGVFGLVIILFFIALYTIGLAVLGGYLGAYLKNNL